MILLSSENPRRPRRVQSVRLAYERTARKAVARGSTGIRPVLDGSLSLPTLRALATFLTPISPAKAQRPSKREQSPRPRAHWSARNLAPSCLKDSENAG
jgi:hypothetical protein